ncbi:uracil-DNA glycosylase-like protein [Aspergillus floccosus]
MSPAASSRADTRSDYDDDVPVNKKTSFNGQLNQYFHASKNVSSNADAADAALKVSTPITTPDALKRAAAASSAPDDTSQTQRRSKRVKRSTPSTASTPTADTDAPAPRRITRSRSAGSTPTSTPPSRSPTTQPTSRTSTPPSNSSVSLLRDTIPPNLTLLLVGVNPGIMTGTTGYAYAHPSNLFWKLLHSSGITTVRHPPSDTYRLPELYNIGNTNIVERPTRDASMLSRAEMNAGVPVLEAKVAAQRPRAVCLVGKSIWEAVWRVRKGRPIRKEEFRYGWQDESENMGRSEEWEGAPVFVATTTSGLAAGMTMAEKEAVWNELGRWVVQRREEMAGR